jgi:GAG-pre-integrase domain
MTSFTKTGCALIDSDDGNCLLAEASITPGGLYVITKAVRRASLAARTISATAASSSSKSPGPLSKDMQMLWHARLVHVGFENIRRAAHTGATTVIDLTVHTKNRNCHTCLLQRHRADRLRVPSSSERQSLVCYALLRMRPLLNS